MAAAARRSILFVRNLGDRSALGREQQTGDRSRVLQRGAGDLRQVNHAGLHEVFVKSPEATL